MTDLAAIRERHRVPDIPAGLGPDARWSSPKCAACAQPWPCDAARLLALLADTPSVEPAGLDGAWRDAEATIAAVDPGRRLQVDETPPGLDERHGKYRAWAVGLDTAWGDTPEAALRALAARLLPTQASDSPEKTT